MPQRCWHGSRRPSTSPPGTQARPGRPDCQPDSQSGEVGVSVLSLAEGLARGPAREQGAGQHVSGPLLVLARMEHGKFHSPEELRGHGLNHLRDAATSLEHTATAEERDDYRRFVLAVASKVAEAHREGGQGISQAEQQVIQDITTALERQPVPDLASPAWSSQPPPTVLRTPARCAGARDGR
jgi:hypothetical protein